MSCPHYSRMTVNETIYGMTCWVTTCARCGEVIRVQAGTIQTAPEPSAKELVEQFIKSL